MEAVPREPAPMRDARFVPVDPEREEAEGAPREFRMVTFGDQLLTTNFDRLLDGGNWSLRRVRVSNYTYRAQQLRVVFGGIDEPDVVPVLHITRHGNTSWSDIAWDDLLLQCKTCHGPVPAGPPEDLDILLPASAVLPRLARLFPSATDISASVVSGVDAGTGAYGQTLPHYGEFLLPRRACCGNSLTPQAIAAGLNVEPFGRPELAVDSEHGFMAHVIKHLLRQYAPVRATFRDEGFFESYLEGLRRFLGDMLAMLRLMAVTLLVALSHLAQTPMFLLVMLATARRFGRRGDGDSHLMSIPTWHPIHPWGAARLAA